jgi:hypothetical protein
VPGAAAGGAADGVGAKRKKKKKKSKGGKQRRLSRDGRHAVRLERGAGAESASSDADSDVADRAG